MTQTYGYVEPDYLISIGQFLQDDKLRTYELMHLKPGAHVLDVGCGSGTDTIALARLVGPGGTVAGVDHDAAIVVEADRRAARAGVSERVRHHQAQTTALPFPSAMFYASRSERLFQHLSDPVTALSEMVRVTKPAGWVVVLDTDWGTASTDCPENELEGRWNRYYAERFLPNGYSGRTLYRLFKKLGLEHISVEMRSLAVTSWPFARSSSNWDERAEAIIADGVMTVAEVQRLEQCYEQDEDEGVFFTSLSLVLVSGRKPVAT